MIAEHRISPETEKSLGHSISKHTWLRFHKDMGDVPYNNLENAKRTWQYCGLDVYSMALVHEAQLKYAARHPGLLESIQQGNDAIRPYLITSLMGIRYNPDEVAENIQTNDRLMRQYLRWLDILIGVDNLKSIRGKGKSSLLTSNPQCVKYFHDICGYPEVGKGKERKDGTKGPSLGKKNMFKLRLKHSNPVIDIALAFRELQKETSTLQFKPFKL